MQLTTTYIDIRSTASSTMTRNISYKDTLFEISNLTPICGKPIFKTLHKLRNKNKAKIKSVYSNLEERAHDHLSPVLTDEQYALIYPTPFVYLTQPFPLIIMNGLTAYEHSICRLRRPRECVCSVR